MKSLGVSVGEVNCFPPGMVGVFPAVVWRELNLGGQGRELVRTVIEGLLKSS